MLKLSYMTLGKRRLKNVTASVQVVERRITLHSTNTGLMPVAICTEKTNQNRPEGPFSDQGERVK